MHPNHWSREHRELIAHLRAQHLPGVDTDDEALVATTIEQARLLLVTAGGLLGLTLTKLLDVTRNVCTVPIYIEVAALSTALLLGWVGLLLGGQMRQQRVKRRYDIYNAHLDVHMQAEAGNRSIDLRNFDEVFDNAYTAEQTTSHTMQTLRWWAAGLTSLGIMMAAAAAIGTAMPDRCLLGVHAVGNDHRGVHPAGSAAEGRGTP